MPFTTTQQQSFPYLIFGSDTQPLSWNHGSMFYKRLQSTFFRITANGMQWNTYENFVINHDNWIGVKCKPTAHAMCAETGDNGIVYFDNEIVYMPDDWTQLNLQESEFIKMFQNGSSCTSTETRRMLSVSAKGYQISLCDIIQSNIDIILDPRDDMLYWRIESTNIYEYIAIATIAIYIISILSSNMVCLLTNDTSSVYALAKKRQQVLALFIILYVATMCVIPFVGGYFSGVTAMGIHLLTKSDKSAAVHLICLGLGDIVMLWHKNKIEPDISNNISIFTLCLLLLLLRVYSSIVSPYMFILVFLFGVRSFYKLMSIISKGGGIYERFMQLCDAFVFSSLIGNGVWYSQELKTHSFISQSILLIMSSLCGVFMYIYKILHVR